MSCTQKQYIFSAEQIEVPETFPGILKNFTKTVVKEQPANEDFVTFSRQYFEQILDKRGYFDEQKRLEAEAKAAAESRVRVKPADYITNFTDSMLNYYMVREIIEKESKESETRVVIHRATGKQRLAKIFKKEELNPDLIANIGEELKILLELDHPYVQKTIEVFEDDQRLYIVQEMPEGGLLFDKLADDENFTEFKAVKILSQLLQAIRFSHQKKIIHRDINPACIWFDDFENQRVKLGGFGYSKCLKEGANLKEKLNPAYYSPPQVVQGENYTEAVDMWGIGVITYMILSGAIPFDGRDEKAIKAAILKGELKFIPKDWRHISTEAQDFIKRLLTHHEADRMTAEEAMNHPWITENSIEKPVSEDSVLITLNHLKNFQAGPLLKQAAMTFLIQNLSSRSELEELNKVFIELDANGNGTISKEELYNGYKKIFGDAFSPEEVDELFKKADTDESGAIDYSEWATVTYSHWNLASGQKLEEAFNLFDVDGNAKVSEQEIKQVFAILENIDSSQLDQMIRDEMDENRELTLGQFKQLMNKLLI